MFHLGLNNIFFDFSLPHFQSFPQKAPNSLLLSCEARSLEAEYIGEIMGHFAYNKYYMVKTNDLCSCTVCHLSI